MTRETSFLAGVVFGALVVFCVVMGTTTYIHLSRSQATELRLKDVVQVQDGVYDGRTGMVIGYDYETRLYQVLDTQGFKFAVPESVLARTDGVAQVHIVEQTEAGEST